MDGGTLTRMDNDGLMLLGGIGQRPCLLGTSMHYGRHRSKYRHMLSGFKFLFRQTAVAKSAEYVPPSAGSNPAAVQ